MGARAFGIGEFHYRLGAFEVVEKLLRLALEIQVFLRIANQRGARDLLREPVLQARDCGRTNANQSAGAEKMSSIQPLAS